MRSEQFLFNSPVGLPSGGRLLQLQTDCQKMVAFCCFDRCRFSECVRAERSESALQSAATRSRRDRFGTRRRRPADGRRRQDFPGQGDGRDDGRFPSLLCPIGKFFFCCASYQPKESWPVNKVTESEGCQRFLEHAECKRETLFPFLEFSQ